MHRQLKQLNNGSLLREDNTVTPHLLLDGTPNRGQFLGCVICVIFLCVIFVGEAGGGVVLIEWYPFCLAVTTGSASKWLSILLADELPKSTQYAQSTFFFF